MSRRLRYLNPYDLHKTLINEYFLTTKNRAALLKRDTSKDKRDIDVIRENHQFLWDEEDEANQTWERRLAKKYYDNLYKEYTVGDLSRYKENKIGLRWRTQQELIDGKGQFSCGNKRCNEKKDLKTWEVNFGYTEHGVKKNALVKLRLCPDCSYKLNYHHKKKEVKRLKHRPKIKDSHSGIKDKKQGDNTEEKNNDNKEEKEISEMLENKECDKESDQSDKGIWKQSVVEEENEEKTREEEFDEYLDQLFL